MVLPVPGGPAKTRCRQTVGAGRPAATRARTEASRSMSSLTSCFTAARPIMPVSSASSASTVAVRGSAGPSTAAARRRDPRAAAGPADAVGGLGQLGEPERLPADHLLEDLPGDPGVAERLASRGIRVEETASAMLGLVLQA